MKKSPIMIEAEMIEAEMIEADLYELIDSVDYSRSFAITAKSDIRSMLKELERSKVEFTEYDIDTSEVTEQLRKTYTLIVEIASSFSRLKVALNSKLKKAEKAREKLEKENKNDKQRTNSTANKKPKRKE